MHLGFDAQAAGNADRGGLIDQSGNYIGIVTKAEIEQGNEQAINVMFGFESDEGNKIDYVRVNTKKRNGERSFGFGLVQSAMGLLNLVNGVNVVQNGDKQAMPQFVGQKIGFGLQKEYYTKGDGTIGWKMNLSHFYDPYTKQTYSEKTQGIAATTWTRPIADKSVGINSSVATPPDTKDEPLPF